MGISIEAPRAKAHGEVAGQSTPATKPFAMYCVVMLAMFAFLNVAAVVFLPEDKYLRYEAPNDMDAPTSYWVYERIHLDPTPIDIAFVGTSRTGMSMHSRRLQEDLARDGISAQAVNLYQVRSGTDIQYVIAKELLTNRKVKVLVVEMSEREERKSHDNFAYLADPVDILTSAALVNPAYLLDVSRLPGRQFRLFLEMQTRRWGLGTPDFVPPPYGGPNLDHAEYVQSLDGVKHYRNDSHSKEEMEAWRLKEERKLTPPLLPKFLSGLEFRIPRYFEERILDLAAAHNTKVVFLYLPRYGGPEYPAPYTRYQSRADLINPWALVRDYRLWSDANHVNWQGAQLLTDYVANALASRGDLR